MECDLHHVARKLPAPRHESARASEPWLRLLVALNHRGRHFFVVPASAMTATTPIKLRWLCSDNEDGLFLALFIVQATHARFIKRWLPHAQRMNGSPDASQRGTNSIAIAMNVG
jgi:hypothetical protein